MGVKVVANNKKAYHEYFIDEVFEAGLVLTGTEIKSIRLGQVSIKESYCRIRNGDIYVENMNISPYEQGNRENHDPTRIRKLLLHRDEIN
ncbi:MAG: SsrA-binding protein, partial [Deltaproteobacteria bacterium]|nr:SsrA-binding protein [Deltaproteobacteria bacterium]